MPTAKGPSREQLRASTSGPSASSRLLLPVLLLVGDDASTNVNEVEGKGAYSSPDMTEKVVSAGKDPSGVKPASKLVTMIVVIESHSQDEVGARWRFI